MVRSSIIYKETSIDDKTFSLVLFEIKNAFLALLSEGETHLGTLALSLPRSPKLTSSIISSNLLGGRSTALARFLSEVLTKKLGMMVLVSVFVNTLSDKEASPIFLDLIDKALEKRDSMRLTTS